MRLPFPADLDLDLDALVDILCSSLVIDTELQQVSIPYLVWPAFRVGRTKSDMVEERAGAALRVLYEEPSTRLGPYLCMSAADDLALERELIRTKCVGRCDTEAGAVCEAADTQGGFSLANVAADGVESERAAGVEVRDETDAVGGTRIRGGGEGRGGVCDWVS